MELFYIHFLPITLTVGIFILVQIITLFGGTGHTSTFKS